MMHAKSTAAMAALALGLVLTATSAAQAETREAPTASTAHIVTAAPGGDITAQQHRFAGIGPSHGSHRNSGQPRTSPDPGCPRCG